MSAAVIIGPGHRVADVYRQILRIEGKAGNTDIKRSQRRLKCRFARAKNCDAAKDFLIVDRRKFSPAARLGHRQGGKTRHSEQCNSKNQGKGRVTGLTHKKKISCWPIVFVYCFWCELYSLFVTLSKIRWTVRTPVRNGSGCGSD